MKKGKVTIGILGLGRSGWDIHVRLLRPLTKTYKIAGVYDADRERSAAAAAELGCRGYGAYNDVFEDADVELVVVALPSHLHADTTIKAFKAGKHVVCEKPLATSLKDADRMIACARRCDRVLSVFQNRRYSSDFQAVKRVIDSGVLGRIVHIRLAAHGFSRRWDWQTLKKYGGGTLNNTCPHLLDLALVLFGPTMPKVFCLRDRALTLGNADDHVKVVLHGRGAPTVEVEATAACAYPQDAWLVMGTRGSLAGTEQELRWKYMDPRKLPKRKVDERPTPDRSYNHEDVTFTERTWSAAQDKSLGERAFYPDLRKTLRQGAPLHVTPESVRRQMKVLDLCRAMAPV